VYPKQLNSLISDHPFYLDIFDGLDKAITTIQKHLGEHNIGSGKDDVVEEEEKHEEEEASGDFDEE